MPAVASLPEYFAEKGLKNPADAFNSPWQFCYRTSDHYFDWYSKRPQLQQVFNKVMKHSRLGRGVQWFEFFPVEERLRVKAATDVALVDVGGGFGHDLIKFHNRFPHLQGQLILEDLPHVLKEISGLPARIEMLGHNFFEPQPSRVRGAKAYYLRTVLHDWPDKQAIAILSNIRDVMAEDSVLLIHESSMPEVRVPLQSVYYDFMMMACFASLERTESQFTELLDAAGFRLVQIWRPEGAPPGSATLFEAMKCDNSSDGAILSTAKQRGYL